MPSDRGMTGNGFAKIHRICAMTFELQLVILSDIFVNCVLILIALWWALWAAHFSN